MIVRCVGEPLSWMRLERYHLGEVDGAERSVVEAHLSECAACRECLSRIETEDRLALPPLEISSPTRSRLRSILAARFTVAASTLAAAAAITFAVGRAWLTRDGTGPALGRGDTRVKGGGITFFLVRDDGERILEDGGIFRAGDRFKAVVTCPPSLRAHFDVAVLDGDGVSFPNPPADAIACGNDVPLPGAFRVSGTSEATVCIAWDEDGAPDRSALARGPGSDRVLCMHLRRAPP
jgi:anti-sigma factor RsiW